MKIERTPAGLEAQVKIAGLGRFFGVAFLSLWLTIWALGESVVLWILVVGGWSLLTGQPPEAGRQPLRPELALPLGLFLLFWVTFWTFGGLMAGRELLRLLFGYDRILVRHDGLEVEHSFGPFWSRQSLRRDQIRCFYQRPSSTALCVETTGGTMEVTRLGNAIERAGLEQALNAEFSLAAQPASEGALPAGWCEILSPEHDTVLVKNPAARRKQAMTTWIICALISSIALYVLSVALQRPDLWGLALLLTAIGALVGWGGVWLSFGRTEWKLDNGRLVQQRRFARNRKQRFEAFALELYEDSSGEDGTSFVLTAVAADAPARTGSHSLGRHRRVIYTQADDPVEPRKFGRWLSQCCAIPFADQTTAEAKSKTLEELKEKLAGSGRVGRAALWIIERLAPTQRRPDA